MNAIWIVFLLTLSASAYAADGASDYAGIALVIAAVGGILSTLLSAFATWKASSAKDQAVATHTAVNSRMDEFKKLFEETFRMKGAEEERAKVSVVAPVAAESPAAILAAAELKAQALIAEASRQASQLLAEAHKVSITNLSANPVPVQVVGPGVDTPLKVTEAGDK